ncbi:hypothetical protein BaRGS_00029267 [Batillaria attramentaria]|uniref:Uncharacterized protein n=1 Tax=Batillaria attramentaria TaxID=370345 RepID=A0ABD0JWM0_9CAEN
MILLTSALSLKGAGATFSDFEDIIAALEDDSASGTDSFSDEADDSLFDMEAFLVVCPVCHVVVEPACINDHLDMCCV